VTVAIASDHAGFPLKENLACWLRSLDGIEVLDLGTDSTDSVDYPDFAGLLCRALLDGRTDRGILICNTGIGMSIAANRFTGIRASLCLYPEMARCARRHNDANVLVLGGGLTAPFLARETVKVFLTELFEGGRHSRRIGRLDTV
jgi:ribose 5-phosphate isomerase B